MIPIERLRTAVSAIVWNEFRERARAPWRIVLPLIPLFAVAGAVGAVLVDRVSVPVLIFLMQLTLAVTAVAVFAVSTRYLDRRRSVREYGLRTDRRWAIDLLAGIGVGIAAVAVPSLAGIVTGWYEVSAVLSPGLLGLWVGLALIVAAYLCTGFWEELVFRGVLTANAAEGLRGRLSARHAIAGALVLQALVFGVAHVDQWTAQAPHPAFVLTWMLSGVVFGILYLLSDDLALPIGVHAAINAAEAGLFSETAPAESGVSVIVLIEPVSGSVLFGHGGIMMVSRVLTAGLLGVLWLRYSRESDLDPWSHPAIFVDDARE